VVRLVDEALIAEMNCSDKVLANADRAIGRRAA
jgi:hypothetical protein